jgi:hypothetical protein
MQVAWPCPFNALVAQVGAVPDGGVTVQVTLPVGVMPLAPLTVTVTVKFDPVCGFCGGVKVSVGVALLTLMVAGDVDCDGL